MPSVVLELVDPQDPGGSAQRWSVDGVTVIGRSNEADIVLNVPAVSRQHLKLQPLPHGWEVADLDSRNGTYLNGDRLGTATVPIHDADLLVVGGAATLRFRDPLATPIAPAIGRLTGVWIDPTTEAVWVDARRVEPPLSARQLRLLQCLHKADGEIVTRIEAIDAAWDEANTDGVSDDALAALVKRLRKRLAPFENGEPSIEIIRHRGIRLRSPA